MESFGGTDGAQAGVPGAIVGRALENERLADRIRAIHAQHDGVVGSPRIWEELRYEGERCGRNRGPSDAGPWP